MSKIDPLGHVPSASIHAYMVTEGQVVTTGTWTDVGFNADTKKYNITRLNETITIVRAGWYDITVSTGFQASNLGVRVSRLWINGTTPYLRDNEQGIGPGEPDSSQYSLLSGNRYFAKNDTLKVQFWHNKGTDLNISLGENVTYIVLKNDR